MDLLTYAIAQQAIADYGAQDAQIESITNENNKIIISLTDGRQFTVDIPTVSSEKVNEIVSEKIAVVNQEIESLSDLTSKHSTDLNILQELTKNSVTQVSIGGTPVEIKNNVLDLPLASGEIKGFVLAKVADPDSSSVNSISINKDGYMEVTSLSIDKLHQNEGDTLILQCN